MTDITAKLAEALRECAIVFRQYEQMHLAKKTQDGDEKAYRNHQMADMCEKTLTAYTASQGMRDDQTVERVFADLNNRIAREMCCFGPNNPDEIGANGGPHWRRYVPKAESITKKARAALSALPAPADDGPTFGPLDPRVHDLGKWEPARDEGLALRKEEAAHLQTIDERDIAQATADRLADLIAKMTGVEIGEHSAGLGCAGNDPHLNAIDAAEAFLRALPADDGWMPIETAPKDGTPVLVWVRGEIAVARWMTDPLGRCWGISTPPHKDNPDRSRSYSNIGPRSWDDGMIIDAGPSHWRPLPAPPAPARGEG